MTRRRFTATIATLATGGALLVPLAGGAGGAEVIVGNLVLRADGGFQPRVLPKRKRVPIRFQGFADIRTKDGSAPPALRHVKVEFDRDGRLNTAGLPVCHPGRIESTTTKQARRRCGRALVGKGKVEAVVSFPLGVRLKIRSPLSLFNGPRRGRRWTAVAHAYARAPISESYVVVAPIERRRGTFGYRASFDIPTIAGGLGALTDVDARIGRRYRHRGRGRSYVTARCSDGILQSQGNFRFADGTIVYGSIFKPCRNRR